ERAPLQLQRPQPGPVGEHPPHGLEQEGLEASFHMPVALTLRDRTLAAQLYEHAKTPFELVAVAHQARHGPELDHPPPLATHGAALLCAESGFERLDGVRQGQKRLQAPVVRRGPEGTVAGEQRARERGARWHPPDAPNIPLAAAVGQRLQKGARELPFEPLPAEKGLQAIPSAPGEGQRPRQRRLPACQKGEAAKRSSVFERQRPGLVTLAVAAPPREDPCRVGERARKVAFTGQSTPFAGAIL